MTPPPTPPTPPTPPLPYRRHDSLPMSDCAGSPCRRPGPPPRVPPRLLFIAILVAARPAVAHLRSWTARLPDGERLLWLSDGTVTAKQTSVTSPDSEDGMMLRQVTDGRRFLQMIYRGVGKLEDCEETSWGPEAARTLGPFPNSTISAQPSSASRHGNSSRSAVLRYDSVPPSQGDLGALDLDQLVTECRANHRMAKRRRKTRLRHQSSRRSKRGAKSYLMAPGTNWCGPSNSRSELGPFAEADRCCRRHDKCQASIPGLARGHYIFNYRPFTVSHCRCDRRFRTCLKMANTGPANIIGNVFFNVVQRKCFILRRGEVCVQRSWWGKCLKMERRHVAHLVDNMPY